MARIAGVDIPRDKRVVVSLTYIYGIGLPTSKQILKECGISEDIRVKDLTEEQENTLFDVLMALAPKVSKDSPLMIASKDGQQIEFNNIDNPEDIITSILGYQVFGILKENVQLKGSEMKFLRRING